MTKFIFSVSDDTGCDIKDYTFDSGSMQETVLQIKSKVETKLKEAREQKEEILTAFLAKYGYEPDEVMQVEQHNPDGSITWFVRKRENAE